MLVYGVPLRSEGWLGWAKGAERRLGRAEKHGVQCLRTLTITLALQVSSRTLPTSRDGSVFFRQQQRQGQLLLHKSKIIPFPPFLSWRAPSANTSGVSASCASGQQGAHSRLSREAPSSRENEVLCWPQHPVTQSPFSSSFCKLFCIFSNFTMLAVSSWHRASTFNCTGDPRPDGTVCPVL